MSSNLPSSKSTPVPDNGDHFSGHIFCAEVIEASLTRVIAQAWEWDDFPPFGTAVCIPAEHHLLVGVIAGIETASIDPSRYPIAYKKTEDELKRDQPQIFKFLHTKLTIRLLGYIIQEENNSQTRYITPPHPPRIHHFVGILNERVMNIFFNNPACMTLLAQDRDGDEELFVAVINILIERKILLLEMIQNIIHNVMASAQCDYRSVRHVVERIQLLHDLSW